MICWHVGACTHLTGTVEAGARTPDLLIHKPTQNFDGAEHDNSQVSLGFNPKVILYDQSASPIVISHHDSSFVNISGSAGHAVQNPGYDLLPVVTDLSLLKSDLVPEPEGCSKKGGLWPYHIHPAFYDKIQRFQGKLPPAATLNSGGLASIGASQQVLCWASAGVRLRWLNGIRPHHYVGRNSPSAYMEADFINERISDYLCSGVISEIDKKDVVCS